MIVAPGNSKQNVAALGEKGEGKGEKHIPYRNSKVGSFCFFLPFFHAFVRAEQRTADSSRTCCKTR